MKVTEGWNPRSRGIHSRGIPGVVELMNQEDMEVPKAVKRALPQIAHLAARVAQVLGGGGRLLLVGAGSSGRLCLLEASEVPPTFGLPPGRVQGVLAGGLEALASSRESAEDSEERGARDLESRGVGPGDLVVAVSASGSTPYALGAVKAARRLGAETAGISCNPASPLSTLVDHPVEVVVGPEVVSGSTRLKAGTAQKMVLNMVTTAAMVELGYVYDGWMVGVQPGNAKLRARATRIVSRVTGVSEEVARGLLEEASWDVRVALVMAARGVGASEARGLLEARGLGELLEGVGFEG